MEGADARYPDHRPPDGWTPADSKYIPPSERKKLLPTEPAKQPPPKIPQADPRALPASEEREGTPPDSIPENTAVTKAYEATSCFSVAQLKAQCRKFGVPDRGLIKSQQRRKLSECLEYQSVDNRFSKKI